MRSLYPGPLLWLISWFGTPSRAWLFFPLLIQLVLVFPRRIGPMRRWPRLFPVLTHAIPAAILFAAFIPFLRSGDPADLGPVNDQLGALVLLLTISLFLITRAAALVYNFRTIHDPVERAQLRWFALGIGLGLGAMVVVHTIGGLLFTAGLLSEALGEFLLSLMDALLLFLPLSLGIAILRYRLFDIDVIIRRTTSYAILTALLALVYFGSIVVLQRLLSPITGESDAAVVLSTLLIAALFLPLRRRVQSAIDRRFFRRKYDAEKVLQQFAATARDETDLDALTAELLRVIQETMEPEGLSIWLKPTTDHRPRTTDHGPQTTAGSSRNGARTQGKNKRLRPCVHAPLRCPPLLWSVVCGLSSSLRPRAFALTLLLWSVVCGLSSSLRPCAFALKIPL